VSRTAHSTCISPKAGKHVPIFGIAALDNVNLFMLRVEAYLTNKEAQAVYPTVLKHDGHLRTRGKCRKHEAQESVFYIFRVFSNARSVLSQCSTRLRILHSHYDKEVMWRETIKHAFSMLYTLIKHGFLTNQSARRVLSVLK